MSAHVSRRHALMLLGGAGLSLGALPGVAAAACGGTVFTAESGLRFEGAPSYTRPTRYRGWY
jgi:hypothetical protein